MLQVYHNNALLKFLNDIRSTLLSFKSRLYLIGLLFHLLYFSPFLVAMRFEPRISQYFDRVLPTPWPYLLLFVIKRNCFTNNDVVVCKYSMALNLCTTVSRESFQGLSFQWVKSLQMHLHTYLHLTVSFNRRSFDVASIQVPNYRPVVVKLQQKEMKSCICPMGKLLCL